MVNFKLGETNVKTKWSEFHERGTKKKSESPTRFEPLTPTQIFSLSHVRDMLIISFSFIKGWIVQDFARFMNSLWWIALWRRLFF